MSLFTLIAFAFLCAALYYICPLRLRWILLLLVSYGYYAYCGLSALPYILTTTLSTWAGALLIGRVGEQSKTYLPRRKRRTRPRRVPVSARCSSPCCCSTSAFWRC